jgi:hypothetical protein
MFFNKFSLHNKFTRVFLIVLFFLLLGQTLLPKLLKYGSIYLVNVPSLTQLLESIFRYFGIKDFPLYRLNNESTNKLPNE